MFCIYRLYINNTTIYIGKTKNGKKRYYRHKSDCYNQNIRDFNQYKYLTIRQLGISKDQFYDYVKYEILYDNVSDNYASKMEQLIMNLYKEIGNCNLWNEQDAIHNELYQQEYYENNKDDIQEKTSRYKKTDKYKIYNKKYYLKNIDRIKEYNYQNKDRSSEYMKQWEEKNKERRDDYKKNYNRIKSVCNICNLQMNKSSLIRHIRRKHK